MKLSPSLEDLYYCSQVPRGQPLSDPKIIPHHREIESFQAKQPKRKMVRILASILLVMTAFLCVGVNSFLPSPPVEGVLSVQQASSMTQFQLGGSDSFMPSTPGQITLTAKKSDGDDPTSLSRAISPLNPYMWFIYMFGFIYLWDYLKTSGIVS